MSQSFTRFLTSTTSTLAMQVAKELLRGVTGQPRDLSTTQIWVSTSGAARRIRRALALLSESEGTGVLSPSFSQPMSSMLPSGGIANRTDREAAWGMILKNADHSRIATLFPRSEVLEGEQLLLGTAGLLCDLCDLLAEGGVTPLSERLTEVCTEDEERWRELSPLYSYYRELLNQHGLEDPNEARISGIEGPSGGITRLFIACIPDLPRLAEQRAAALRARGVDVQVLVWKPESSFTWSGGFDAWGRPLSEEWRGCLIPLAESQIVLAKDPADEAARAMNFLGGAGGDHALILGDAELTSAFKAEILNRSGTPFLPEGLPLERTEAAMVASEWITLRRERHLKTLRRLLECPEFSRWLCGKAGITLSSSLEACDHMATVPLAESLDQASGYLHLVRPEDPEERAMAREERIRLEVAAAKLLDTVIADLKLDSLELLQEIWPHSDHDSKPLAALRVACNQVGSSPLLKEWEKAREPALIRAIGGKRTFDSLSEEGDTDLSGWLEAPWVEARRLAVCGCVEGKIPASSDGHPFLPDQKRRALGINDRAARQARDLYLMSSLRAVRGESEFRCSLAKFGSNGSPSIPSTLLLRCSEGELAARVKRLFAKADGSTPRPRRASEWKWSLPMAASAPVKKISPTDFGAYLRCPFRFYLEKRLGLRAHAQEAREMDALQFGDLIHRVLERFGTETPEMGGEGEIASLVLDHLEREVRIRFGPDPSPAVRVQVEAAKVRLRSFARVQAQEYADGWRILAVEKKIPAEDPLALSVGGLKLSAKIDRIERNGELIRVIDYKAQSGKVKGPEEKHFGPASAAWLEEAQVEVNSKHKCWSDLQLPLYRKIAESLYPNHPIQTAYFVLAADPEESRVIPLELGDDLITSAMCCAEAVALRVGRGVFWPPQPVKGSWEDPFAPLFLNGEAEASLDAKTIAFLKGQNGITGVRSIQGEEVCS